jgi:hypothetical protein
MMESVGITNPTDRKEFIIHVEKNLKDLSTHLRKMLRQHAPFNMDTPLTLMFEHVRSKTFECDGFEKRAFEERTWIRMMSGEQRPLDDRQISSALIATAKERRADRNIRVYAAAAGLRPDRQKVAHLESLIVEKLKEEFGGYLEAKCSGSSGVKASGANVYN